MHPNDRPALLVGRFEQAESQNISDALAGAAVHVERVHTAGEAKEWVAERDPLVVLVRFNAPGAEDVCFTIRANPRLSLLPIIGLTDEITDLTFAELYGWGGDDLVLPHRPDMLERRLRLLPRDTALEAPKKRGIVVVADGDPKRRMLLARVLRNAGFDARFAQSSGELTLEAARPDIALVVADVDLEPKGALSVVQTLRRDGNQTPWVVAAPPRKLGVTTAKSNGLARIIVYDCYAPHENALFFANEAARGSFAENRSTPRLLFGTTMAFRLNGRDCDDYGYVYNISGQGIYVRTMAPLASGDEAWLEFQPPRTDRRVRLEGKVIWRRPFGQTQGATVPPGFGLSITGGSASDLMRYRLGYDSFAKDMAAVRLSSPPDAPPPRSFGPPSRSG